MFQCAAECGRVLSQDKSKSVAERGGVLVCYKDESGSGHVGVWCAVVVQGQSDRGR